MWNARILGYEFYYLLYNFIFYSFFGWIYESCFVSFREKKWVNRGFLNGPIVPLYGTGATLIYIFLSPMKGQYLSVYLVGAVIATALELVTAFLMEKLFHAKWWDYSNFKINYKGRICLAATAFWGVLALLVIELIQPLMDRLINWIPREIGEYGGYVILLIFFSDLTVTVLATVKFDQKLAGIQQLRTELSEYIEGIKLSDGKEEWRNKLEKHQISELIDNMKDRLEKQRESLDKMAAKGEWDKSVQRFKERYSKYSDRTSWIHRRLINAFPNLKSIDRDDALNELKDRLKDRRKKK